MCEDCNETLKRLKVAAHLCKCSCSAITCVDCNKSFYDDSYLQHSTCMSEAERYEGHLYQAPKKKNAQDAWSEVVEQCATDVASAPQDIRALLPRLAALDNVPRNEKKFKNFVGNSLNLRNAAQIATLWAYLAEKRDAAKAAFDAAKEKAAAAAAAPAPAPVEEPPAVEGKKKKRKAADDDEPAAESKKRKKDKKRKAEAAEAPSEPSEALRKDKKDKKKKKKKDKKDRKEKKATKAA